MRIVWPLHRRDYLTTFDSDPTPYYSAAQRVVDYGIAMGWVIEGGYEFAPRALRRMDGQLDWQLHAKSVGLRWMTVREFCDMVEGGTGNLAIVAHQLKTAVDKGLLERKLVDRVIRGKSWPRWCYRATIAGGNQATTQSSGRNRGSAAK